MNTDNDENIEIEQELNDPEIRAALVKSKREIEQGDTGTEEDIFKILRRADK